MLEIKNVSKKFKNFTAVNDINYSLEKGKMLGFLGRNGAGKTTTFRMILGVTKPTKGTIFFNNNKVDKSVYNHIGYLPEERGLHIKYKVIEELEYMAKLKGLRKKDIRKKIDYWLKEFDLESKRNEKIENLSKGNQQKVQLLVSILHDPELIILDEPFSGLDPINVELLKASIISLKNRGKTIILSTHRMEHVEELCDEIIILNRGNSILQGNINSIKSNFVYKNVHINTNADITKILKKHSVLEYQNSSNNNYYFKIEEDTKMQSILSDLILKNIEIKNLEITEPTINQIFVEKVGGSDE